VCLYVILKSNVGAEEKKKELMDERVIQEVI
jgi:hypothetical protein